MKKLTFKVIEEGRILNREELRELRGGDVCASFTGCNTHDNCYLLGGYESCRASPTVSYGYESDGGHVTCNIGYTYSSCSSSSNYTSCGSTICYTN